jgi:hypothetical protein
MENILGFYKAVWLKITILLCDNFVKVNRFQNNLGINTIVGY